jgi:hypothetical protein
MAGTNPNPAVFFGGAFLLLVFAPAVFRVIVRREYRLHRHLTSQSSSNYESHPRHHRQLLTWCRFGRRFGLHGVHLRAVQLQPPRQGEPISV